MFRNAVLLMLATVAPCTALAADANVTRGAQLFQNCAPCHSLEPGKNMTGPSLSNLWDRKAGDAQEFERYSAALKSSGIMWNDQTLNAWLADPQHVVPGNTMTFPGIKDAPARADLLAYLKEATQPGSTRAAQQMPQMGGMMNTAVPNLRVLDAEDRVQSVGYCRDTYEVKTADGKQRKFWERNLRFKTDSSHDGPERGAPALVPAGMMGDRADVIFATPDEIGQFVKQSC
jgi:cytochrome c